jgi:pimeloyl-ACP methyl ester carboxylesterase
MILQPQTEYVKVGGDRIAYQVVGEGPIDLLYSVGWFNSLDAFWDLPDSAYFLRRLAGFSRLIGFDPRGSGASDSLPSIETFDWETRVEDMTAVLDAVGSQRPAVFALGDACAPAMLFAATQPERVGALILVNPAARFTQTDDYPFGLVAEAVPQFVGGLRALWGTERLAPLVYPSRADDPRFLQWFARYQRALASPRTFAELFDRLFQLDVRHALPLIHTPTLVLGTDYKLTADHARYTAEHIEGARIVWFPTMDATPVFTYVDELTDLVEEFITGVRRVAEPERRLATGYRRLDRSRGCAR